MTALMTQPALDDALRERFGHDAFRPGQREVMEKLLAGRSTLAVFPTGAGKSLCYQLPALLLDGLTVVVSPLIALMKDQVDALAARGVQAARLDSSLEGSEVRALHARLDAGEVELLYVAPERLANERFLARLRRTRIALLAIDEAHCISEWGHNFRPDYLRLARLARELKVGRVLALTATATPSVSRDVRAAFGIAEADHVQTGFHRPNLELVVTPTPAGERLAALSARLEEVPGPSIVYVTLQRTAEEVAEALGRAGVAAAAYHAGLEDEERGRVQDAFMRGETRVVVATIAFGMGIDKADIRAVYHFNLPKTLENYAQEVGRAGRDGAPARCELFACADDLVTLQNFTWGDTPTREAVAALVEEVLSGGRELSVAQHELSARHDVRPLVVSTALTYLELDGLIQPTGPWYSAFKLRLLRDEDEVVARFDPGRQAFLRAVLAQAREGRTWRTLTPSDAAAALGEPRARIVAAIGYLEEQGDLEVQATGLRHGYRRLVDAPDVEAATDALMARFQERERRDVDRSLQVARFCEEPGCRAAALVAHFGEALPGGCGRCSGCEGAGGRPLPATRRGDATAAARALAAELRAEEHEALAHPRQVARFLCGLSSPATTKAKLTRDRRFGRFAEVPFGEVLAALPS